MYTQNFGVSIMLISMMLINYLNIKIMQFNPNNFINLKIIKLES